MKNDFYFEEIVRSCLVNTVEWMKYLCVVMVTGIQLL